MGSKCGRFARGGALVYGELVMFHIRSRGIEMMTTSRTFIPDNVFFMGQGMCTHKTSSISLLQQGLPNDNSSWHANVDEENLTMLPHQITSNWHVTAGGREVTSVFSRQGLPHWLSNPKWPLLNMYTCEWNTQGAGVNRWRDRNDVNIELVYKIKN